MRRERFSARFRVCPALTFVALVIATVVVVEVVNTCGPKSLGTVQSEVAVDVGFDYGNHCVGGTFNGPQRRSF